MDARIIGTNLEVKGTLEDSVIILKGLISDIVIQD